MVLLRWTVRGLRPGCHFALLREGLRRAQAVAWARAAFILIVAVGTPISDAYGQPPRWRAYVLCNVELQDAENAFARSLDWTEDAASAELLDAATRRKLALDAFIELHVERHRDLPGGRGRAVGLVPRTCSDALAHAKAGPKIAADRFRLSTPHAVDAMELAQCLYVAAFSAFLDATINAARGYAPERLQRHANLVAAAQDQMEAYRLFSELAGFAARDDPKTCS